MVRSNGDGTTRVLVTRPSHDAQSVDLYVVSVDATDAPPVDRLLAADLPEDFNSNCKPGPYACADARGRLLVYTGTDPTSGYSGLARVDPVTGDRLDFESVIVHELSPSGGRLIVFSAPLGSNATLYDPDDRAIRLDIQSSNIAFAFIGEVAYYLTSQQQLMRLAAGGSPELVTTGVTAFSLSPQQTTGDPLLVIRRPTADPNAFALSILDTVTGEETFLPTGSTVGAFSLSPDGRWIATFDNTANRFTFTEWTESVPDSLAGYSPSGVAPWRPGHDEIWLQSAQFPDPSISINRPGVDPVQIAGLMSSPTDNEGQTPSFTADGTYWFPTKDPNSADGIVQVALADDPTGPRFDLQPAGTTLVRYWELADGRILAPVFTTTATRSDVYAIDPATGHASVLGEEGAVMAVGHTRILVNQHIIDNAGDLTVFDLATGRSTMLAVEFTLAALVEPVKDDAVAPGAHVAFQFQARFASPYDGIWLATVP